MGGKHYMVRELLKHVPPHRTYIEPFFGAGNLFWNKPPSRGSVINDIDAHVVNFFRVLRNEQLASELIEKLKLTPYARDEYEYAFKNRDDIDLSDVERARLFFIRARQGATTVLGKRSASRTNWMAVNRADEAPVFANAVENMASFIDKLRRVMIENDDALRVLARYDNARAFFYIDPPYCHSTRKSGFYRHEMGEDQHVALIEKLITMKGKIMLSGYPSALYDKLTDSGWRRVDIAAVCCVSAHRASRTECLWMNYAPVSSDALGLQYNQEEE
jgi:DNA adenine methylase